MKSTHFFPLLMVSLCLLIIACKSKDKKEEPKTPSLKEENVTYSSDSTTMNGFVVYDENIKGPRPAVLVVHEWWGLNDYDKMRARELARLGYTAMAIDMYGNGATADNPKDAEKLAVPFYMKPDLAKARFDAALNKLKTVSQADTGKIAAIGYCFGGAVALSMAKMGEDLKGVVSFHGNLAVVPAQKGMKADVLVCHGAADQFVTMDEVNLFKHQMDSVGAHYDLKIYPGATHSFTNPNSTAMGEKFKMPIAYNGAADTASWNEMKSFFNRIFK
ncbi:MAG TPA: dienelactone hydrolase family protein [Chitinophagaceae bacterium]|nr:dienelactone hydrolase family protein [Chitinophagaceae bacterium]